MKRFFLFLSALSLATVLFAQSGKCGPNLYWSLDKTKRTVTITGTGPMNDYGPSNLAPWHAYKDYVYYFVFEGTPSKIGSAAFRGLTNCYSITIPNSVTSLDNLAFHSSAIKEINLPASISYIEEAYTFDYTWDLIAINVDSKNPYYCSVDGVLFNKDKTRLLQYPKAKTDFSYVIPNGVKHIRNFYNKYLQVLTIPNTVNQVYRNLVSNCENLHTIYYERGFNPLLTTQGEKPHRQINFIMIEPKRTNQYNSSDTSQSTKERLESLKSLYNSGLITKEEYERKRAEIISTL